MESSIHVLCLGNSIMKGDVGVNWVSSLLQKQFPSVTFHNLGINGSQIPGVIDQVKTLPDSVKNIKYKVILLHIGG